MSARRYPPPRALLDADDPRRGLVEPWTAAAARYARHVSRCERCSSHPEWHRPENAPGPEPCPEGRRLLEVWDRSLPRVPGVALLVDEADEPTTTTSDFPFSTP